MRTFTQGEGLVVVTHAASAMSAGDLCCVAQWTQEIQSVTKLSAEAFAISGVIFGCVLANVSEGGEVAIVRSGTIFRGITELPAFMPGPVRANLTTGRCERVATLGAGDIQVGTVDNDGTLSVDVATVQSSGLGPIGGAASTGKALIYGSGWESKYGTAATAINVLDCGADNTGILDSTAAIQAAIDAAGAYSTETAFSTLREVYFPPGQYLITAPLQCLQPGILLRSAQHASTGYSQVTIRCKIPPTHSGTAAVAAVASTPLQNGKFAVTLTGLVGVDRTWLGRRIRVKGTRTNYSGAGTFYIDGTDPVAPLMVIGSLTGDALATNDFNLPVVLSGSASANNSASYDAPANSWEQQGAFRFSLVPQALSFFGVTNIFATSSGAINFSWTRDSSGWYTVRKYISPTSVEIWFDAGELASTDPVWACRSTPFAWSLDQPAIEILAPDCQVRGLSVTVYNSSYSVSSAVEMGAPIVTVPYNDPARLPDYSPTEISVEDCVFGFNSGGAYYDVQFGCGTRIGRPLNINGTTAKVTAKSGDQVTITGIYGARGGGGINYEVSFYGSTHSGNNGTFPLVSSTNDTIVITNADGVVDTGETFSYTWLYELSGFDNIRHQNVVVEFAERAFYNESATGQGKAHTYEKCSAIFVRTVIEYNSGWFTWNCGNAGHCETFWKQWIPGDQFVITNVDFEGCSQLFCHAIAGGEPQPATFVGGRCDLAAGSPREHFLLSKLAGPITFQGTLFSQSSGRPVRMSGLFHGEPNRKSEVTFSGCRLANNVMVKEGSAVPYVGPIAHRARFNNCLYDDTGHVSSGLLDDASMHGSVTIAGGSTAAPVTFGSPERRAYRVLVAIESSTPGAVLSIPKVASKTTAGFTINVIDPGGIETITLTWQVLT